MQPETNFTRKEGRRSRRRRGGTKRYCFLGRMLTFMSNILMAENDIPNVTENPEDILISSCLEYLMCTVLYPSIVLARRDKNQCIVVCRIMLASHVQVCHIIWAAVVQTERAFCWDSFGLASVIHVSNIIFCHPSDIHVCQFLCCFSDNNIIMAIPDRRDPLYGSSRRLESTCDEGSRTIIIILSSLLYGRFKMKKTQEF